MTGVYVTIFVLAVVILSVWTSGRYGKATAEKKQAEDSAHDMEEDAAISSEPFVDNPVGLMRGKKK